MKKRITAVFTIICIMSFTLLFGACSGESTPESTSGTDKEGSAVSDVSPEPTGATGDEVPVKPAEPSVTDTVKTDSTEGLEIVGTIEDEDEGSEYKAVALNGIVYMLFEDTKTASTVYTVFSDETITEAVVPETLLVEGETYTVTEIGTESFYFFDSLGSVSLPDTIKVIGDSAFYGCSKLRTVNIPDSVEKVLTDAFCECEALVEISFPDSVKEFGDGAFYGCISLKRIKLPAGLKSIPKEMFCNCEELETIEIPAGVESIGNDAFWFCETLKDLTLPEGLVSIGSHAFYDCMALTELTVPGSVSSIGEGAFLFCESLETLHVSESLADSLTNEYATETFEITVSE